MSTYCTQAAYRASVHQLFDESSLLKDSLKIAQEDYMQIWRKMAEKKRMTAIQITQTNRRDSPLWESLERIVNEILRSISITDRTGRVSVALDDDTI